jgi:hypothetical protein
MVVSHVRVSPDVVVAIVPATSLLDEILCFFPPRGARNSMKFGYVTVLGALFVCCCYAFSVGLAITLISLTPVPTQKILSIITVKNKEKIRSWMRYFSCEVVVRFFVKFEAAY